jgi:hypothetical protein
MTNMIHIDGKTVRSYRIIGTTITVFEVLESYAGHSTLMHLDGEPMGTIGSRKLTPDLANLPAFSHERINAVRAYYDAQYDEAYVLIVAAFPEATSGRRSMGQIEVVA